MRAEFRGQDIRSTTDQRSTYKKSWKDKTSLQGIAVNALFVQTVDSETDNNFTKILFNSGQILFGEQAVAEMLKEYKQIKDMSVLRAIDPGTLSKEQKQKALRSVNLIKQNCTGSIKGRMCANGDPHRKFVPREKARSPTLSLEALIMSLTIDAHERRKVTVFDVPGA